MACIASINISARKGVRKTPVGDAPQVVLVDDGLENDAHAGKWHRQVSFLAEASLAKARDMGLEVGPGDFAENFTTEGIDLLDLPLGTQLRLGKDVLVEISQIGKVCHTRCAIYHLAGDCIFPREGIFGVVLHGGAVSAGDAIEVVRRGDGMCTHTPPEALAEVEAARKAGTL